jgi:adenylate cyclase
VPRMAAAPRTDRRLTAILAADVAGYSRLVSRDERGTINRLKAVRKGLVEPVVARHGGRIVKLMGDGALVEFASAVGAVEAAAEIQGAMAEHEAARTEEDRIRFRIGINLGDIVVDGDDILGDGVNVAARLEALAEPGGVCVSGNVHEQVRDKLPYPFEDLGERIVKNIPRPVRVYALPPEALAALPRTAVAPGMAGRVRATRRAIIAAAALGIAAIIAAGGGWRLWAPRGATAPAAAVPQASRPAPAPRLSVVVLPFTNLGLDPGQEYVSDGITDDLTTDLSRIEGSFVIARATAFTYKGKQVDPRQIGRDLGVRYVLDGSVRRAGDQVRVNVQLIDAATGAEVWADRFDGAWTGMAAMQDEVTARLARILGLELVNAESRRAQSERPNNPDAMDLAMRARSIMDRPRSRELLAQARDLFEQALRADPQLREAQVGMALTLATIVNSSWSAAPAEDLARADALATRVSPMTPGRTSPRAMCCGHASSSTPPSPNTGRRSRTTATWHPPGPGSATRRPAPAARRRRSRRCRRRSA